MTVHTAGIIVIGDEVLKGQVADSNVPFLAKKLHSLGIKLCKVSIIPDDIGIIAKEVSEFSSKYDQVITSGGIGPTHDDVTYEGVGAAFLQPLVVNQELLSYWSWFNGDPPGSQQRESTVKMATIPRESVINYAHLSTSLVPEEKFPVITMNNVCILPGLPKYMRAIFNALEGSYFKNSGHKFNTSRIYLTVFESTFAHCLNEVVKKYPDVTFGSYPKLNNPYFKTVVTLESENERLLKEAYNDFKLLLNKDWIAEYGELLGNSWNRIKELIDSDEVATTSLTARLKRSIEVLEKCLDEYQPSEIFISFNGGKDCTVLIHLVQSLILKRYNHNELPVLNAVYIRTESPFTEVEDFIAETANRYNLNLITEEGPLQKGIQSVVEKEKDFKVAVLGIRRSDPSGAKLSHIKKTDQGWGNLLRVSPLLEWSYQNIWTYLRELNIPYCKLYDLGILSEDPLKEASEECEYICEPLSMAFGPLGRGVMIPDITGQTISRIASQLLNIFDRGESPIRDMLIKSSNNLETVTGDGIKTYFILLNSLLKNIKRHNNKSIIFNHMKRLHLALLTVPHMNSTSVDVSKIICTFFYTRFTLSVTFILTNLFKKWIDLNLSVDKDVFSFLLNNFDALVYHNKSSFPLDESKIIEGVTLSGHYIGKYPKQIEQMVLKVLYFPEDCKDDKTDIDVRIESILKEIEDVNEHIILIINNDLPDKGKHLLRKRKINVLMLAEPVTTKLLAEYTMLHRSKHKTDLIVGFFCDLLSYMTNITLVLPIFQLQICAPTKTYMKAYSASFRSCLRLCRFALDSNSYIVPAGQFERLFALYFGTIFGNDDTIPVNNRSELEKWQSSKELLCDKMKSLSIIEQPNNIEQLVINIVLYLKSLNLNFDNEVVHIICEAMMEVARKIPESVVDMGYEPLSLKIAILQRTLAVLLTIMNTDKVITCKRFNCFLDEEELSELE